MTFHPKNLTLLAYLLVSKVEGTEGLYYGVRLGLNDAPSAVLLCVVGF